MVESMAVRGRRRDRERERVFRGEKEVLCKQTIHISVHFLGRHWGFVQFRCFGKN